MRAMKTDKVNIHKEFVSTPENRFSGDSNPNRAAKDRCPEERTGHAFTIRLKMQNRALPKA
jgi:hypothetical protein